MDEYQRCRVSIPFKRESISKVRKRIRRIERGSLEGFNSLQTGKYIQSLQLMAPSEQMLVSIPFKRESISKVVPSESFPIWFGVSIPFKRESISKDTPRASLRKPLSRVSIPFKRESISKGRQIYGAVKPCVFQFPSNGKVYPKSRSAGRPGSRSWVSIPFKRERD